MPKMWEPTNPETLRYYVDTILNEASDKLTDWESKFIDNLDSQLRFGRVLSEKQEYHLERIYAEKTK